MGNFETAYDQLNPAQKQAVDTVDGAVLVIAGPGTGKTQLLSVRVANILKKTDSSPENILCLTFTNKAAANMQLRLSKLIGSPAQKVTIKTFHGFATEIMANYPSAFWNGARLVNVPDALQLEIITDILSALPLDNPLALKFAGQFTSTKDVQDALRLSKEAGLTPDKLRTLLELNMAYIDEVEPLLVDICAERLSYKRLDEIALQLEDLPEQETDDVTRPLISLATVIRESFETAHTADEDTGKTKNVSAWKSRWIKNVEGQKQMFDERQRNAWWLALADVYESYRAALHARGYFDYADMIIEVITQLESNPDIRADIQEHYQYVLIDEFQDTNAAQLRLSHLVADHYAQSGNPNIMAVGDDDQSIYKFNGAELSNMLGFKRSYPDAKVFVLTDNYRSSQAVLDFSMDVISQASQRVTTIQPDVSKILVAKNAPKSQSVITHISYPTKEHEYYGISKEIAKQHKAGGSVAVLARGHDSLKSVAHILHQQGVAVRYEQQQSVLEQPLIKQLTCICEIIVAINHGDQSTLNACMPLLLQNPAWRVSSLELWELAIKNHQKPRWVESMLDSSEKISTIANWLLWLAQTSLSEPLPRILELVLGLNASEHMTSPLRQYYLEQDSVDTPYLASISAVHKLSGLAQDFAKHGSATTEDFVRLLHVSRDNNRTITDDSLFVTDSNAVELLTVHKAKGLEFDSVFVVDAMESIWKPSLRGRKPPANLPLRPSGDDYDDFVRLMFVAITRAKQNVTLTSFYANSASEPALPSSIIRDILPARTIDYADADKPEAVLEASLRWPRLEGSKEQELLKNILDTYTLSPSALLDFLDVAKGGPQYFLEKYLLHLPEAQSVRAAFGSAMHKALETAQQLVVDNQFEIQKVYNSYENALQEQLLSQNDYDRYLDHGQKTLERLFTTYNLSLTKDGRPEEKISVVISNAPVSGKLDRVDVDANTMLISDYKTGTPLNSFKTSNKLLAMKAWRHRTQLSLYALMARESGRYKTSSIEAQMIYVEAETEKELIRSYVPESSELDQLEKLIGIVWDKISTLNLPDVRHYQSDQSGTQQFIDDLLNKVI